MNKQSQKVKQHARRHARVRARVAGVPAQPRLAVFRSGKHIYAQVIDDRAGKTLAAASDLKVKAIGKVARAKQVGEAVAKLALAAKVKKVAFDRGGHLYTGRIKALAEGARAGGLEF